MLNRPSKAAVTWVVGTVGALVALFAILILATSAPDSAFAHDPDPAIYHIHYEENGEGPVATFTSEDPEGAEVDWDVTGLDAADFEISSTGVLTFMKQPNYEMPTDRMRADVTGTAVNEAEEAGNREYLITVRATEMRGSGETRRALSMKRDVTIVVDNVDEPGVVELRWLEPEVHTEIMATLTDPDYPDGFHIGGQDPVDITWTWHISKVRGLPSVTTDNHWTDVTSETDTVTSAQPTTSTTAISSYTPLGVDAERRADGDPSTNPGLPLHEGKYLRAVASYDGIPDGVSTRDTGYEEEVARGMSANPVRADRTTGDADDENGSPDFEPDTITIMMAEDADVMPPDGGACDSNQSWCVGEPIVAEDPNRQNPTDILTYELVPLRPSTGNSDRVYDDEFFTIGKATGQIKLVRTLDYEENNDGREYGTQMDQATKAKYEFQVRATDPSGDIAIADVTVEVMDRNDAPAISGMAELRVMEQDSDDLLPLNDPDGDLDVEYTGAPGMTARLPGGDSNAVQSNTYTASDEDAVDQISWSLIGEDGDKFILSADGVAGENEPRDLMFKPDYTPDFEAPTDANGDNVYKLTIIAWDRTTGYSGRKMDEMAVTVIVDNVEETGRMTLEAENRVGNEPVTETEWEPFVGKEIMAAVDDPDKGVAIVTWQWSKSASGDDDDFMAIGGATTATYRPGDDDEGDFLRVTATYTDTYSGQQYPDNPDTTHDERVVENNTPDAKDPVDDDNNGLHGDMGLYRVTATSAYAVRVKDVGPPGPDVTAPPVCPDVTFERSVGENAEAGTFVGAPLGDDAMCTNDPTYELIAGVRDNDYFSITMSDPHRYILNDAGTQSVEDEPPTEVPGWPQITVGSIEAADGAMMDPPLDYEAKGGAPFIVTVTAKNDDGEDTFSVSITLEDLNESPWFNKASRDDASTILMFMENSMDLVATYNAMDPDMESIVWELTGRDADDFTIVDGVLRFKEAPDYEKPTARVTTRRGTAIPAANVYMITVRATEDMAIDGGPDRSDELPVTVTVQNEDETGKVVLSLLQPEVGTKLEATTTDPDDIIDTPIYAWYRAKFDAKPALAHNPDAFDSVTDQGFVAQWEAITVTTGDSYTPQGREAQAADEDNRTPEELTQRSSHPVDDPPVVPLTIDEYRYLLVVATYEDATGKGKKAIGTSAYAVRRDVLDANNSSVDFQRNEAPFDIKEDMAGKGSRVGRVSVPDADDEGDVITYGLIAVDTDDTQTGCQGPNCDDVDFFIVDKATGDISVKKALDHEADDGRNYDGDPAANPPTVVTAGEYIIIVRATDPSGETTPTAPTADAPNSDDVQVKVTVMDSNDAPKLVNGTVNLTDRSALALVLAKNVELWVDEADSNKEAGDTGYYTMLGEGAGRTDENLFRKIDHDAGDAPKEWRLERPDGSHFQIGTPQNGIGRIIQFTNPPNYEDPQDEGKDNVYNFDVVVIDNDDVPGRISVRVEVMNINEEGMLTLSPEEPTEDQMVTATLEDPDGVKTITSWMWEKRTSSTGGWKTIPGATTNTTTGVVGEFLQASVEYRDGWSAEDDPVTDRVEGASPARVNDERNENDPRTTFDERPVADIPYDSDERLTKALNNAVRDPEVLVTSPGEVGPGTPPPPIRLTRHVYENVPGTGYVGDPIIEAESGYRVEDSGDGQYFRLADTISAAYADSTDEDYTDENRVMKPGQIAVNWEPMPALDKEADKNIYTITVRDPNAPRKSPIELTIIVDDVNEAPSEPERLIGGLAIGGTTSIRINEADDNLELGSYRAVGGVPGESAMWSLSGTDASMFTIDTNGMLRLNDVLDYEAPMDVGPVLNELQVTVELTVGDDSTSKFVTVTVVNMEEPGMVTLTPVVPAIGAEVMADLTDPDGNITGLSWRWSSSDMEDGPWTEIAMATSDTYMPREVDRTMYLQVVASYTDGQGSGKMAKASGPVASVPTFASETMVRMVDENTAPGGNVGDPVMAGAGMGAMLTYTLAGTDASSFNIGSTGQITVGTDTMLDYETKASYEVTVRATDPDNASDSVALTIMVVNMDEDGVVTVMPDTTPQVGTELTASLEDPDGSVANLMWQWQKGDGQGNYADIPGAMMKSYTPVMADEDSRLQATAMYADNHGAGKTAMGMTGSAVGATPMTGGVLARYDADNSGDIQKPEYLEALTNYILDNIDKDTYLEVLALFIASP